MSQPILRTHLERRAVVYLRQSTLRQVHENQESTRRQYDLRTHLSIDRSFQAFIGYTV